MNLKQSALEYARRAWRVFPLHDVQSGTCSCLRPCKSPGKHPRTSGGLLDASDDVSKIETWWNLWPTANIGILTGAESGIVVIDVDDPDLIIDVPDTVSQRTGSGGRHYLFRHPGEHVKTTSAVMPSVDSRGDGGYIVAPPSLHHSGNHYEWIDGPDDIELAEVPAWWTALLTKPKARPVEAVTPVAEGGRNNALFEFGVSLWKKIPLTESEVLAVLMAKNLTLCLPPLDDDEVSLIAHSIAKYDGKRPEEVDAERLGAGAVDAILKSAQAKIAENLVTRVTKEAGLAPDFMPKSGIIRDIAQYILSQSERPLPQLAVGAATAFVGALAGGRYQTSSRLGPNVLLVGLAESGSGKQKARTMINNLAEEAGLLDYIGADDLASSAGLITEMVTHPSRIFMLDEFGIALASITGTNAGSHKREIMSTIMKLYSSYGTTYNGTAYADQKARPKQQIKSPCLVIYGTSTHKSFYDALSSDHGADGFVSRLLVIPAGEERPTRQRVKYAGTPGKIKQWLLTMPGESGPDGKITARISDQIDDAFYDLDESMTELMDGATEMKEQARSIYSRVAENAMKMALIYAISEDYQDPVIDHDAFLWGREIAIWCANHIMEKMVEMVGDSENERTVKRMILVVKKAGKEGIDRRSLQRRFYGLKAHERDEMIADLINVGEVFESEKRIIHAKYYIDKS